MIAETSRLISIDTAMYFLTAGNILYLICYGVKDVLWLRIFCVSAIATIMPYYFWGTDDIQFGCVWWNLVFFAINMFWIVVLIQQRRPPRMTDDEKQLYAEIFAKSCTPREMLKLLSIASNETAAIGDKIVHKMTHPNGVILIDKGSANVVVGGDLLAKLGRGDFVGEMSYLTGEPAVADVVAATTVKFIRWATDDLNKLFAGRSDLKSALNEILGHDLVRKLTSSDSIVPELSVDSVIGEIT